MNELIASLIRPSARLSPDAVERLAGLQDWGAFCALVGKTGCAPLIHDRLRDHMQNVPRDVSDWLKASHDRTIERNRQLLDELNAVTRLLSAREIPALVLKGPVLAFLGTGLQTRSFSDLDLLVRPDGLMGASAALRSRGFVELRSAHPFHRVFVKMAAPLSTVVELHFDLIDRERRYTPQLSGVWDGAVTIDLPGCTVSTPSITDHLLLTLMQLPHHWWSLRLLVDIVHVATRWTTTIEWGPFMTKARAWGMRALAGSTLHAAASLLHLALPAAVVRFAEPETYVHRLQWHLVREALSEQLRLDPPRLGHAASCLVLDQPGLAPGLVVGTVFRHSLSCTGRRFWNGLATVPSLLAILSRTAIIGHRNVSLMGRGRSVE